jgi:hypothetical protein
MPNTITISDSITIDELKQIGEIVSQSNAKFWITEIGAGVITDLIHQSFQGITVCYNPESIDSAIKFLELTKNLQSTAKKTT